jgi:hypothetical protein
MGLDTSHDCYHGSYSGFKEFRNKLALAAGYKLKSELNLIGHISTYIDVDWTQFERENFNGVWKRTWEDPLMYLIAHSDCEGNIEPKEGKPLSARLKEILPLVNKDDIYFVSALNRFITGLDLAASKNENVEFN